MNKELVWIGRIENLVPAANSDFLEVADTICGKGGRWLGIVRKGDFKVKDLVEVYLQDGLLPQSERFDFMSSRKWRVRIQKLRGNISECLIMPLTVEGELGDDITQAVGVTKYHKPIPKSIAGQMEGHFPIHLVPKTDEPNFQAVPEMLEALQGHPWYATLKYDGSSGTAYIHNGHFGVCSRNYELKQPEEDEGGKWANIRNAIWYVVRKHNIEEYLKAFGYNVAVQFEVYGEGIQKNPLKIKGYELAVFNVYNIDEKRYESTGVRRLPDGPPLVQFVAWGDEFDGDHDNLVEFASKQTYPEGNPAEGIVIRPLNEMVVGGSRLSFKVINPEYKD